MIAHSNQFPKSKYIIDPFGILCFFLTFCFVSLEEDRMRSYYTCDRGLDFGDELCKTTMIHVDRLHGSMAVDHENREHNKPALPMAISLFNRAIPLFLKAEIFHLDAPPTPSSNLSPNVSSNFCLLNC